MQDSAFTCGVAMLRTNMCAHDLGREKITHIFLYRLAFKGIVGVTAPKSLGALNMR
jgi:hypothetical protein